MHLGQRGIRERDSGCGSLHMGINGRLLWQHHCSEMRDRCLERCEVSTWDSEVSSKGRQRMRYYQDIEPQMRRGVLPTRRGYCVSCNGFRWDRPKVHAPRCACAPRAPRSHANGHVCGILLPGIDDTSATA